MNSLLKRLSKSKMIKKFYHPCPRHNPLCKDSLFGCRCGVIGTTAAIIGGVALAGAGAVAAGMAAGDQSEQAAENAQAQRDWETAQYGPAKELEKLQLEQYKNIQMPYTQDIYDLWKDYGKAQTTEQYKIFGDVGLPAERELATQLKESLTQPLSLPQDIWDKVWQQAREKSLAEYAPIEQRTSQRLAASGGIGQGPAESLFKDIELSKAKSIETIAIDQAISEWNEKKAAKQQAYENVFRLLGYTPSTTAPSTATSGVGVQQPYVAQPYQTSGVGEGIASFINNVSPLASLMGSGSTGSTAQIIGGSGGYNTGNQYVSSMNANPVPTWSPYKV